MITVDQPLLLKWILRMPPEKLNSWNLFALQHRRCVCIIYQLLLSIWAACCV